jgi:hypothetical protein
MDDNEVKLIIPKYNPALGIKFKWEPGFEIETKAVDNQIIIIANDEGLLSLANHLLNLSQKDVPKGSHIHLDEHNSLESGSIELIIEKV